ncbi:MAG: M23 family metallopeptidase [Candidatus Magasanikbacteria bacterium]
MSTILAKNTVTKLDTRLGVAVGFLAIITFFVFTTLPIARLFSFNKSTNLNLSVRWTVENISGSAIGKPVTAWPINSSGVNNINSPFGPRLKASSNFNYDFHRGIDIVQQAGASVKAIASGKVYGVYNADDSTSPYFIDGGNTVVIEHTLPNGKFILFHGKQYTKYYSHYLHLQSYNVVKDQIVAQGTIIGRVGHTGTTELNHLHLEIRVATPCSYEFQENNPERFCSRVFGTDANGNYLHYDPHINPLRVLNYTDTYRPSVSVVGDKPLKIKISQDRRELDINEISVYGIAIGTKIVNFDERAGIDLNNLDSALQDNILIEPERFNSSTAKYEINFTFNNLNSGQISEIIVKDIWGNGVKLRK